MFSDHAETNHSLTYFKVTFILGKLHMLKPFYTYFNSDTRMSHIMKSTMRLLIFKVKAKQQEKSYLDFYPVNSCFVFCQVRDKYHLNI